MIIIANHIIATIFFHLFQLEALLAEAIEDVDEEEPSGEKQEETAEEEFELINFGMMDAALQDPPQASSKSATSPSTTDDPCTDTQEPFSVASSGSAASQSTADDPCTDTQDTPFSTPRMAGAVSHLQDLFAALSPPAERKLPESDLPTLPVPDFIYPTRPAPAHETPVMQPYTEGEIVQGVLSNEKVVKERSPKKTAGKSKITSVQGTSDCEHDQVVPGQHWKKTLYMKVQNNTAEGCNSEG